MTFTQHPLSAAYPAMQAYEYQALVDSISDIGVQVPVTLYDGQIIDGWHRYQAATECGMDCPMVELGDVDPQDFARSQSARRNITESQIAIAITSIYQWRPNGGDHSALRADCSKTTAELAVIAGVGTRTIERAKAVQSTGTPEVVEAVRRGDIGLPKAAKIAAMPAGEQAAAITRPLPKPAPVVEPEHAAPTDYTKLDAAYDQISELQSELVVARMGDIAEEDKQQAATLIAELRAEVKTLEATLKAVALSRDQLMEERSQMLRQMAMQRKDIEKLKASK